MLRQKKRFYVPYLIKNDNDVRQWEVEAYSKTEAREIAFRQLSTDPKLRKVGSITHVLDMGEVKD